MNLAAEHMAIFQLKLYTKNWQRLYQNGKCFQIKDGFNFLKYYFPWRNSLLKNHWDGPIQDGMPWITFSAIDFLNKQLSKTDNVFEYGTGGSTIFFSQRVNTVVSVEHDPEWFQVVLTKLGKINQNNVNATCIQGEVLTVDNQPDNRDYQSCYSEITKTFFHDYVNSINKYPDNYFDLVVIDGRARPSCIKQAQSKVKPGKYLLLDNSERNHYQLAINHLLKAWTRITFEGPTPYLKWFTQTSIWRKPT